MRNAVGIIDDGFRPSRGGMLGPGVYWSDDIAKTRPYVRNGSGTVLKLRIRNGRTKTLDRPNPSQMSWHTEGYDSAWVPANTPPSPGWVQSGLIERKLHLRSQPSCGDCCQRELWSDIPYGV